MVEPLSFGVSFPQMLLHKAIQGKGGEYMALDALNAVILAEEEADRKLASAAAAAKKILAEAEAEGLLMIAEAEAEAEKAGAALYGQAQLEAAKGVEAVKVRTAEESRTLREEAGLRLPQAVQLVVERIVRD